VFAIGWQMLIFHDMPTVATIVGAALIIGGTLVVTTQREPTQPAPPA
jgi:drug/metabolite transporter (DMT)-like permease